MRRTPLAAFLALALALAPAACATDDPPDDDLVADVLEGADDGKADQADLPITPVEGLSLRESVGVTEQGRVIRSAAAFRAAFGVAPPADLDFAEHWLAVYSAGIRPSGGFTAAITRVRLSESGKTVKVSTTLEAPGEGCLVTRALTKPVAIVKFPAQPGASRSRFGRQTNVVACTPELCGDELTARLTTEVEGMTYMSESDYPLTVLSLGTGAAPTVDSIRALVGADAGAPVEQRAFAEVMDQLGDAYDPNDPYIVAYAQAWRELRATMEGQLSELAVFRVGEIQVDVYFVGVSSCGEVIAVKTTSIET